MGKEERESREKGERGQNRRGTDSIIGKMS